MDILLWKYCKRCEGWKLKSEFSKDATKKDGLFAWCKKCASNKAMEWQKSNPQKAKAAFRKWQKKNIEQLRERRKGYSREQYRRDQALHPEKKKDKDRNRRARKAQSAGKITTQEIENMKAFYNHTCLRCGRREPDIELTHDHVKPLAMGGENTIENSQPLCRSCNSGKRDRWKDYRPKFSH